MTRFKKGKLPNDPEERLKYLYRFQELLRLYHNQKGKEVKEGKLDIHKFREFQQGWFKNRSHLICNTINNCKQNLSQADKNRLLEIGDDIEIGTVKDKEKYKKDNTIEISIEDIEDN